ncbi:hypothetical protein [Hymenobacter weizhouensis]|uniref:hypothetical protein n=1 Tax=Hymenobacter sp. YIM 151500-1 TaxID=2987689 RepID=UPI00222636AA|nr:hypothetical protein [Hymenobacter sp. YIM 151500-1]UYZ63335.1 hypothetical protein OIS53_00470 [Hymenobacter sp. YIM 151500-1]
MQAQAILSLALYSAASAGGPPLSGGKQPFVPADSAVALPVFLQRMLAPQGKWYQTKGFLVCRLGELYKYSNVSTSLVAYVLELAAPFPDPCFSLQAVRVVSGPVRVNPDDKSGFATVNQALQGVTH